MTYGPKIVLMEAYENESWVMDRLIAEFEKQGCELPVVKAGFKEYEAQEELGKDKTDIRSGDFLVSSNHWFISKIEEDVTAYHIHHGVGSSKNYTYREKDERIVIDFVASNFAITESERRGECTRNKVPAGFIQMDELHRMKHDKEPRKLLVAPTWNAAFNNDIRWVEEIIPHLSRWAEGYGFDVVVQCHPYVSIDRINRVIHLCKQFENVEMTPRGTSLIPLFEETFCIFTDMGSAMFEYLPTGKPIFAFNSFKWWEDRHGANDDLPFAFDEDDLAFRWRDMCYQFQSPVVVPPLLHWLFSLHKHGEKDPLANLRAVRTDTLFGSTLDGRIAERIVSRILNDIRKRL